MTIQLIKPGFYPNGAMAFPWKGEYVILSQGDVSSEWNLWYSQIEVGTDLNTVDYNALDTQGTGTCGTFDEMFFECLIELYSVSELDTMLDNLYEKQIGYRAIAEGTSTREAIKILLEHQIESLKSND